MQVVSTEQKDITHLVSLVRIKVFDVEDTIREAPKNTAAAKKRELENRKLVNLVSILTNKIFKNINETRNELKVRYMANLAKVKEVEAKGIGTFSSQGPGEICERTISYRIEERMEENADTLLDIEELDKKQKCSEEIHKNLCLGIESLERDNERCRKVQEDLIKDHQIQIKNIDEKQQLTEEVKAEKFQDVKLKLSDALTHQKDTVNIFEAGAGKNIENNLETEKQKNMSNTALLGKKREYLDENESKHKITKQQITVNNGRIEDLVYQTEDNFTKLCLVQSKNSHESIANILYDFSGKSTELTRMLEQDLDFIKNQQLEYALSLTEIDKGEKYTKSKLKVFHTQAVKTLQDGKLNFVKMEEAQSSTDYVYNRDNRYNLEHAERLEKETQDERENMQKVLRETSDLSKLREKAENSSSNGWGKVKATYEKELSDNTTQDEKVNTSDTNLQKQTLAIEENQKHGLDQLTMFKKSQSEGLLSQFDNIEKRIENVENEFKSEVDCLKLELDTLCRNSSKAVKTFIRDQNLDLNSAQHEAYRELRAVRSSLDETVMVYRREIRENTSKGHEGIRRLRNDEVGPAVQTTNEYRSRVDELERVAVNMSVEIDEFPRYWKPTLLFHGIPFSEQDNFYILGHAVCDIIGKTLGIREEMMITEIVRLVPSKMELGGCPPLAVTFRNPEDKDSVLRRAVMNRPARFQVRLGG